VNILSLVQGGGLNGGRFENDDLFEDCCEGVMGLLVLSANLVVFDIKMNLDGCIF
jgi:hypothetical protein